MHRHVRLVFFIFSAEMGSHLVAQVGLELLALSSPLSSALQSAGVIGVSHSTQPLFFFF